MQLRVGVGCWLLSWVPYGLLLGLTGWWLVGAWTLEILLGFVGIALAGAAFAQAVKVAGWRSAPRVAWAAMRDGDDVSGTT